MFDNVNIIDVVGACALFGLLAAVVLLLGIAWRIRQRRRQGRLEKRLGLSDSATDGTRELHLWRDGKKSTTVVPAGPRKLSLTQRLQQVRRDAGWNAPLSRILAALVAITLLVGFVVFLVVSSLMLAAIAAGATIAFAWLYVQRRVDRRRSLYERQLVDALRLAGRSLRAGHPLLGAFQLLSEDMDDPIKGVFTEICQQHEMGVALEAALAKASAESSSEDMRLFATSVGIQLGCGGNLADMMDRIAEVIHERIRLSRRVRVITAQTQFSKRILLALPFILFVVLYLIRPDYMATFLTTQVGKILLSVAAGGLLLGAYVMNRMARIEW